MTRAAQPVSKASGDFRYPLVTSEPYPSRMGNEKPAENLDDFELFMVGATGIEPVTPTMSR